MTRPFIVNGLTTTPAWTAESNQDYGAFGFSAATAGDVNGDGYSDVIVGAYVYDNGQSDEGRAFLYLGSVLGLATTAAWTAECDQAGAYFGWSVATAGDVNGDGYSDVVVGAPRYNNGLGRVFGYLGSASGLNPSVAWFAGDQAGPEFGSSVATAGDVNDDGYSDVIVGAPRYDNNRGHASVYLGSSSGLDITPAWDIEGDQTGGEFGNSVATAGDVNGDSYSDVIVGAYNYSNGEFQEGRAFVYLGSASGLAITSAWTGESDQAFGFFGNSVATAGDVNGDGYSDVIVGANGYDHGQSDEGRASLYLGSASGLTANASWTGESDQTAGKFGNSVATAGDVNGDGFADVIVGAIGYSNVESGEGRAYLYLGSASGLVTAAAWTVESNQVGASLGNSVATAGDVNGDGYSDVVAGAPNYGNGETAEGRAYVYSGSASGPSITAAWTGESNQVASDFGFSVATAGDVNGDGYSDVIVGAPNYSNGQNSEGRSFVYLGSAAGLATTAVWSAESDQSGADFGYSVATAGDVNGDGYSDVIVGAIDYQNGQTFEGRAYVYLGSASGLAPTAAWTAESDQANASFGSSVATAGDVNGDGYSDVIVGSTRFDNGQTDEGRAYVYLGSASGLALTAAWSAESDQAGALFGCSVASAGDVNGDGYSDVIIGSKYYANGQPFEGRAFVYLGSASGLAITAAWTGESNQDNSNYGSSVATAGDVNADGYSDVIVGASYYDNGDTDEGRASVYLGSAAGLAVNAAWITEIDQAGSHFGVSVATAGDVNGDGYSDVILGADSFDNGQTDEGLAFVYTGSDSGLADFPAWIAESNQSQAEFGFAVATSGDVNGDGYSDVLVGDYQYDNGETNEGRAHLYYGNGGDGLDRAPRQLRPNDVYPISLLGKSPSNAFGLRALGRSPAGRDRVRLEWEAKPLGIPFGTTGHTVGPRSNTGAPMVGTGSSTSLNAQVAGLLFDTPYRWRLRILANSPFFPRSPWFSLPYNASTETDVRTAGATLAVPVPLIGTEVLRVDLVRPNPSRSRSAILYTLPRADRAVLSIHDVQGREVALLRDAVQAAGSHSATWDGRDRNGALARSGLYWVRLRSNGQAVARKLVRE